jgi:hypothetical protein
MEFDDINRELRELCEQNCDEPVPDCLDLDLDAELVAAIEECMLEEELAALNGTAAPIDMTGWTMTTTKIISPYFVEPVQTMADLPAADVPGAVRYVDDQRASYMFKDGKWIVFSMTTTKPDRAPPRLLTDTCDGIHPPRSMDYFRRFSNAPTGAEELKAWASIGVSGRVLREWADVYPIGDPVVFKVPKGLRDRSEFCTDVPRKHSAGPNPCGEVTLMSSRPCTPNHVTLDIDLTRSLKSITLSDIGVGPKKRKILSSR